MSGKEIEDVLSLSGVNSERVRFKVCFVVRGEDSESTGFEESDIEFDLAASEFEVGVRSSIEEDSVMFWIEAGPVRAIEFLDLISKRDVVNKLSDVEEFVKDVDGGIESDASVGACDGVTS